MPSEAAGPAAGFASMIRSASAIFSASPVRVIEIAFSVSELFPASICRLFDDASQENTSSVMASW